MRKNILILCAVFLAFVVCITIQQTLAKYTSEANINPELKIADWLVKVNGTDITTKDESNNVKEYTINDIHWIDIADSDYYVDVEEGYIAPGKMGSFSITLDASECKTAVDYEVFMNFDSIKEYIHDITGLDFEGSSSNLRLVGVYKVVDGNSTLLTSNDGVFSGSILLNELDKPVQLRADIIWEFGDSDPNSVSSVFDSLLGSGENNKLSVPVTVNVRQKIGA